MFVEIFVRNKTHLIVLMSLKILGVVLFLLHAVLMAGVVLIFRRKSKTRQSFQSSVQFGLALAVLAGAMFVEAVTMVLMFNFSRHAEQPFVSFIWLFAIIFVVLGVVFIQKAYSVLSFRSSH